MELPQSRPLRTQGRKSTHDFLSLYPSTQQDPRSSQGAAEYLKTHDFLQPLEKSSAEEEHKLAESATIYGKPPPSREHSLPGGIGTYSIGHISNYINQRVPIQKPDSAPAVLTRASSSDRNDDQNSNCSSYTGSGFTLWEESAGKTGKQDNRHALREEGVKMGGGQWTTSRNMALNDLSYSQQLSVHHKNQSFTDMIRAAKSAQEDEDDDDDDDDDEFIKKEQNSHRKVKIERKGADKKPNTPRSKHSATEQRRRSKINDRFQMLRDIIPHSDQKRDKATFLLEVIEYIQFLQEKANKYDSYQGWNHGLPNLVPLRIPNDSLDQSRPPLLFATKCDENNIYNEITNMPPSVPIPPAQPKLLSASRPYSPVVASDAQKDGDVTVENDTVGISNVYSQGLLDSLTKALKGSGVDLSQASISVQIDIAKIENTTLDSSASTIKDNNSPENQSMTRSRVASRTWGNEVERTRKRLKTRG
jgi:hypothetical protein